MSETITRTQIMKIYNTLTKQIEDIKPINGNNLSIYSCGPTVYSHVHIGNLASFIYADTLRRIAKHSGLKVEHVMNFTDIDDKTIKASQEKYPSLDPKQALTQLTEVYSQLFLDDMESVGNDVAAYKFIKATDYIDQMKRMIRDLVKDGYAYIADDGVYFSINKYIASGKQYGQLSQITRESTSESRINNDEYDKDSIHDFALWKKQKDNEPGWEFTLDEHDLTGRPGWHIECSAMSKACLDQPFDVHTGGVDLIFPHHENEIAQSTANGPKHLANYFLHNEHLLVDSQKMSKSLNNFITLDDIKNKGYDPLAFRLLMLQAHFSSQAHFSWDNLEAAANRLADYRAMAVLRWQGRNVTYDAGTFALEDVGANIASRLADNLSSPQALALLSNVSTQLQTVHLEVNMIDHFENMLKDIDNLLGLDLYSQPDITSEQKSLISKREAAREAERWEESDNIRNQLKSQNILIKDAPTGTIWFRA